MFGFCEKNKGAISVFLTLILLPVLMLGGLTTDAARIYMSKVVISDAGEMAMNAGLAQYDAELHDEYGLFAMEKAPEAMQSDLADFFKKSLNGEGLAGTDQYDKILDLVTEEFKALNVEGSQIYKSEVEKQQIVEYMKYRAPVCLTEELIDKLKDIKGTKKKAEAMVAQMEFADKMEDCQDAMEDAKDALDLLSGSIKSFPGSETIKTEINESANEYQTLMSSSILMAAAIENYTQQADGSDAETLAHSFIDAAAGVSMDAPYEDSFDSYMSCLSYQRAIDSADKSLDDILDEWKQSEPDEDSSDYKDWKERKEELEDLIDSYNSVRGSISGYPARVEGFAYAIIETHSGTLKGYADQAQNGQQLAGAALERLEEVKKNLEEAKSKWETWSEKTDALGEDQGEMKASVDDYGKFFGSGDGSEDISNLDKLINTVKNDKNYFEKTLAILNGQSFFDKSLAQTGAGDQYHTYFAYAKDLIGDDVSSYSQISDVMSNYGSSYKKVEMNPGVNLIGIDGDTFYEKLKQYCETSESEQSEQQKEEANKQLEQTQEAGEAAKSEDGYPEFDWGSIDQSSLPSVVLQQSGAENTEDTTDVGGSVNEKKERKDAIAKFKKAINASTSFLDGLDQILTGQVENLYVAEYAMQMFSYYTVDKDKGQTIKDDEILSLNGYKLKERKAYKAEVEYVLWGNSSSKTNIQKTVMTIFGIRMLLNSFFAFTNPKIVQQANWMATTIAGAAPYLIPIIQVLIQLGFAGLETASDIAKIKDGYGVTVIKTKETWATYPCNGVKKGDNTKELSLNYREFLRIFLNLNMLAGKEDMKLARMADCIQINTKFDLLKGYTMLAVEAKVKSRTTFMKKVSEMGNVGWSQPDNTYPILYQSILGY